jgi:1,4-dihydroxy-6-naphthoate synthase
MTFPDILWRFFMAHNEILLGHSSDADDAFMLYALAGGKVSSGPYDIKFVLRDIQTLNEMAMHQDLDLATVSFHAYPYIRAHYCLLTCGAEMSRVYGPIVVAREPMAVEELMEKRIAIPGSMTTAFLLLRLMLGDVNYETASSDQIIDMVVNKEIDAGLIIHKGELTYPEKGLHKIIDLGVWWARETGLPLPLSAYVAKKSLPAITIGDMKKIVRESILYGMDHFDEALDYAMTFVHHMSRGQVSDYINMYVTNWSVDCGEDGKKAVAELFSMSEARRLIPSTLPIEFV